MTATGDVHFGTFPTVFAGDYFVEIREQLGASPDTDDLSVGQGIMHWNGTAEINNTTIDTLIDTVKTDTAAILIDTDTMEADLKAYLLSDVIGAGGDTLEDLSNQLDVVSSQDNSVFNIYGTGE